MKRILSIILCMGLILSGLAGCSGTDAPGAVETDLPESDQQAVDDEPAAEPQEAIAPVDNSWAFASPESVGASSAAFEAIHRKFVNTGMLGMVTVKDGYIIDEFYQDGYDENSVFRMNSVTKSVMGALIGMAMDQGYIDDVDTPLTAFFPQLADMDDAQKQLVTLEQLLTHTTGIGVGDSRQGFEAWMAADNRVEHFLSLPMTADPGAVFDYTTAGSHMLSAVLQQATGITTEDYAARYLFGPIGIESAQWLTDPQGVTDGGNGLSLTVRDAARFGLLYAGGGNWRGQQLVPQSWVDISTQVHAAGEPDKGPYGYQFWIRSYANGRYSGYYALGYAGQFIFVVPELNLVTAIASRNIWSDYTGQVCFEEIIAAVTA